jgi:hypothetical protein
VGKGPCWELVEAISIFLVVKETILPGTDYLKTNSKIFIALPVTSSWFTHLNEAVQLLNVAIPRKSSLQPPG